MGCLSTHFPILPPQLRGIYSSIRKLVFQDKKDRKFKIGARKMSGWSGIIKVAKKAFTKAKKKRGRRGVMMS